MALKDLKSDLSKFRKPVEKPLTDKKRVEVPKTTNQTPLSQFVDKTPSAPKSNTTTPKQGVTPNKFDNSSNFLGETTQNKFDNSSNYLGETNPSKFDNSSNFLGETTPSKMSLEQKFLGQTEPNTVQQGDKFKGETETQNITQGDRFKGETTPNEYSNAEKFKGETTPLEFKFEKKFLGETEPKPTSLTAKFLGETEPNVMSLESKFLGETTPVKLDLSEQFLGETTPKESNLSEQFLGETDPGKFTFNPELDSQAKDPKFVDFITDDNAKGFSPYLKHKDDSSFVGVDPAQTQFDNTNSLYGNFENSFEGLSFRPGYKEFKLSKESGNVPRYTPDGVKYEDGYTSIAKLMEQRNSPSFLDKMYAKFNLKDDSPNFLNLVNAPYILTGIQRKKISKGEPQFWDFGLGVDDGFIRGGIVASTTRALVDVLRIGSFFLSVKGLLWGVKQVGMQRTQKYGKTWTPINLLANIAGQHIGLKFDRPGILPIGDETFKYKNPLTGEYRTNLERLLKVDFVDPNLLSIGLPIPTLTDPNGGFDSIYGIGLTTTTRRVNTFDNAEKDFGNNKALFSQTYGVFGSNANPLSGEPLNTYKDDLPVSDDEVPHFGVAKQTQENSQIPIDGIFETRGLNGNDGTDKLFGTDITDYEAISYGKIKKLADNQPSAFYKDFRKEKTNHWAQAQDEVDSTKIEYSGKDSKYFSRNIAFWHGFPETFKTQNERISQNGLIARRDNVGLLKPNDGDKPEYDSDLVILGFKTNNSNRTQFRGTVSGITETFSPSWNSEKPNGRADKVYMLSEFERTLSFSFKAVAYSRHELVPMWEKLKQLATFAMPYYGSSSGYRGRVLDFTLGDLYKDHKALLTSLSYTMSDEAAWELEENYVLPKLVDISVGLTLVGNVIHNENSTPTLYSYGA